MNLILFSIFILLQAAVVIWLKVELLTARRVLIRECARMRNEQGTPVVLEDDAGEAPPCAQGFLYQAGKLPRMIRVPTEVHHLLRQMPEAQQPIY